eukprot:1165253-Amphidinium_carterae.2
MCSGGSWPLACHLDQAASTSKLQRGHQTFFGTPSTNVEGRKWQANAQQHFQWAATQGRPEASQKTKMGAQG